MEPALEMRDTSGGIAAQNDARILQVIGELVTQLHGARSRTNLTLHSELDRDLGLDSVSRIELLERIERAFSIRLSEDDILRAKTVADVLRALRLGHVSELGLETSATLRVGPRSTELVSDQLETLPEVLRWHAERHPERIHAQIVGPHGAETLSYGRLYESAARVAAGIARQGVKPGDRVALMLPTGLDYLRSYCATMLLGAVPVPLYPPLRPELIEEHMARQQRILENAQPALMICMREARTLGRAMQRTLSAMRVCNADQLDGEPLRSGVRVRAEDLALIQYTSGSTGDPKGVMLSHANLLANMRAMGRAVEVTQDDVLVSWLPLYHDMGLIGGWLAPLYHGFPVVLMSPLYFLGKPVRWLQTLSSAHGTISMAPNFAYELCIRRVLDADLAGVDLRSWRVALNGSEAVSAKTIDAFCERFASHGFQRQAMFPAYGLAECSVALAFPPVGRGPRIDRVAREPLLRRGQALPVAEPAPVDAPLELVACGRPLQGHELRVVDDLGHECAERQVGSVEFRGPSATAGYFRRDEENARLFDGTWLRTGDMGYVAEGDLFLTGRSKDLIIRAGQHVFPQEVEEIVGALPGIRRGCVVAFGSVDPGAGTEQLVVVAETRETDAPRLAELSASVQAALAQGHGGVDRVVLVPPHSVPKTSSGKLRRSACKQAYEQGRLGRTQRSVFAQASRLRLDALRAGLRQTARVASSVAYASYVWLTFALVAPVAWWGVMLLPSLHARLALARACARLLGALARVPLRIEGLERLRTPCVVVANHQSNIDPFVLSAALPIDLCIVGKGELARSLWTRLPLSRIGMEYVERSDAAQSLADARRILQRAMSRRTTLVFFPEGTHSRVAGLLPFRMGAFLTAAQAGLPVVPIVLQGTRSILRSDTWLPRRGAVRVVIGPALLPRGKDFAAALELARTVREYMLVQTGEPDLDA